MPKIPALPPLAPATLADGDEFPINDLSASNTTKRSPMSAVKAYLAAATSWIIGANITDATITPAKWTNPYKFSAYRNAAQSSTNGTAKINLDTELFDSNNNFASGTYTAPINGFYQFNWRVLAVGATTGIWNTQLFKNGALARYGSYGGSATNGANSVGSALLQLTAGDTIDLYLQASGVNAIAVGSGLNNGLDGYLVTPT